ncbi:MAG: hypothetical protein ACXW3X_04125 [Rhodoplanes sp.]
MFLSRPLTASVARAAVTSAISPPKPNATRARSAANAMPLPASWTDVSTPASAISMLTATAAIAIATIKASVATSWAAIAARRP